jgi:hypothetical protein
MGAALLLPVLSAFASNLPTILESTGVVKPGDLTKWEPTIDAVPRLASEIVLTAQRIMQAKPEGVTPEEWLATLQDPTQAGSFDSILQAETDKLVATGVIHPYILLRSGQA